MNRSRIVLLLVTVAVFAGGGWWLARSAAPHKHELEQRTDAQGHVYYTCAMHPQVRQDEPGNCPICGMKLVRRGAEAPPSPNLQGGGENSIQIDARAIQTLGVRTARVERAAFSREVVAVGTVEVDERAIYAVESRAAGWVEQLLVRSVGAPVRKGQRVAGIYSPELFAAQQELVLALKAGDAGLIQASRQRLALLGLPPSQIEAVAASAQAQRQAAILAPESGIVIELNVREGQQLMPGTPLMRVANLSRVWVSVDVPEAQGAWVRSGHPAEARLQGLPGKVFSGTVDYVYPRLDTQTRSVRARLVFDNPGLVLKPGMFASVALSGGQRQGVLRVPSEALIRTGERTVVILAEGEGRFRPAVVNAGDEHEGHTEILSGLAEGETIVVSGQFLIDSEANLRGALARLAPPPPSPLPQGEGEQNPSPPAGEGGDERSEEPGEGGLRP